MRREFIQELRRDSRKESIDIYDRIDPKEIKRGLSGMHTAVGDLVLNFPFPSLHDLCCFLINRIMVIHT